MRGGDRAVSQPVWNHNKLTLLSGDYFSAHIRPSRKSFSPQARDFIREHIFYHSFRLQSDKQMAVCVWSIPTALSFSHMWVTQLNEVSVSAWMKVQFVNPLSRDKLERESMRGLLYSSSDTHVTRSDIDKQTRLSDSEHTVKDLSH